MESFVVTIIMVAVAVISVAIERSKIGKLKMVKKLASILLVMIVLYPEMASMFEHIKC